MQKIFLPVLGGAVEYDGVVVGSLRPRVFRLLCGFACEQRRGFIAEPIMRMRFIPFTLIVFTGRLARFIFLAGIPLVV